VKGMRFCHTCEKKTVDLDAPDAKVSVVIETPPGLPRKFHHAACVAAPAPAEPVTQAVGLALEDVADMLRERDYALYRGIVDQLDIDRRGLLRYLWNKPGGEAMGDVVESEGRLYLEDNREQAIYLAGRLHATLTAMAWVGRQAVVNDSFVPDEDL